MIKLISGIHMTINLTKQRGSRITKLDVLCTKCSSPIYSPIDPKRDYHIVTNSFLIDGGNGNDYLQNHHRNRLPGKN